MLSDNQQELFKYAHLVSRLAYEDDFRESFTKDPRGVLTALGISLDGFPSEPCKLPSKEYLQQQYEAVLRNLTLEVHSPGWSALGCGSVPEAAPDRSPPKP